MHEKLTRILRARMWNRTCIRGTEGCSILRIAPVRMGHGAARLLVTGNKRACQYEERERHTRDRTQRALNPRTSAHPNAVLERSCVDIPRAHAPTGSLRGIECEHVPVISLFSKLKRARGRRKKSANRSGPQLPPTSGGTEFTFIRKARCGSAHPECINALLRGAGMERGVPP